ncbi:MAG: hypothetical protein MUF54_07595 [Polyangiaceae bacterium]|jgi:hypothetical protein|nr:hypothetical protein [Polyangiaceae bacterium]
MLRPTRPAKLHAESFSRTDKWLRIKWLALDALRREEAYRAALDQRPAPVEPSIDALLASVAAATVDGQVVAPAPPTLAS